MKGFLARICFFYGLPVCVHSWPLAICSALIAVLYSSTYIWKRFLVNLFFPSPNTTLLFDTMTILSTINFYEMITVIIMNFQSIISLITNSKGHNEMFKNGLVFHSLETHDKLLTIFCLSPFVFTLPLEDSTSNIIRFCSYCFVCSLSHLKIFQFCAILLYYTKEIAALTKLLRFKSRSNMWTISCLRRYHQIKQQLHSMNSAFNLHLLVSFSALMIDIVYVTALLWMTHVVKQITLSLFSLYLSQAVLVRFVMLFYMSGCVSQTIRQGEVFMVRMFSLIRANNNLHSNKVVCLYLGFCRTSLRFSACKFFDYGNPIVPPIIASIATYLVIIVQFQAPT